MSKFRKNEGEGMPELNTSSLPDLIFTILFFFMMVTSMREFTPLVRFKVPAGTELEKLVKKSTVSYIYIGPPVDHMVGRYGRDTRIQMNDKYCEPSEVIYFVGQERAKMSKRGDLSISIKEDEGTKMGVVTDLKQMLRKAYALRISYSATQRKR